MEGGAPKVTNQKPRNYLACHGTIQRVELFRPIEFDRASTVEAIEDDIVWIITWLFLGYIGGR